MQLLDQLDESKREAASAFAARDAARAELEVVVESQATHDVDLMRMRHEYETDEILVVGGLLHMSKLGKKFGSNLLVLLVSLRAKMPEASKLFSEGSVFNSQV